jgi:hypothetical protein
MEENGNLFLILDILRSELQPLETDGKQAEKLKTILEDIGIAVRGLTHQGEEVYVLSLLASTVNGIQSAKKLMQEGQYADSALTAKMSLTNLLANRDLFL